MVVATSEMVTIVKMMVNMIPPFESEGQKLPRVSSFVLRLFRYTLKITEVSRHKKTGCSHLSREFLLLQKFPSG